MSRDDQRLEEARAVAMLDLVDPLKIDGLRRAGDEWIGPCPNPACGGEDRFSISVRKNLYNCRHCGGGDAIALVQLVKGCDFKAALDYLVGERPKLSDEELEALRKKRRQTQDKQDAEAEKFREKHIRLAQDIWRAGVNPESTPVRSYLEIRGFTRERLPVLPRCLRYHRALPYMVQKGRDWVEIYRGPAMLAVIATPDGQGSAVHRTWIDLARPKGKALVGYDAKGKELNPKTVLGSKKGGAIRLFTPPADLRSKPLTLYMGEGIETTLTAAISGDPGALYWAGVDLGNMTGKIEQGAGLKYAGRPNMTDERAFIPPAAVERLVFLHDGDSNPELTYAKLMAGIRRAMLQRKGLTGGIVRLDGIDLNDMLAGGLKHE